MGNLLRRRMRSDGECGLIKEVPRRKAFATIGRERMGPSGGGTYGCSSTKLVESYTLS